MKSVCYLRSKNTLLHVIARGLKLVKKPSASEDDLAHVTVVQSWLPYYESFFGSG